MECICSPCLTGNGITTPLLPLPQLLFDLLKSQSSTHYQPAQMTICLLPLLSALSWPVVTKKQWFSLYLWMHVWFAYSVCEDFTWSALSSFFLSPSALDPAISPPAEESSGSASTFNRCGCSGGCCVLWYPFVVLVILSFQPLKSGNTHQLLKDQ